MMKPKVKILVACHKPDPGIRHDKIHIPIHVGHALHPETDVCPLHDDTGENISDKNGSYCELTALYWAWKNLGDTDYVGLSHYRRYFALTEETLLGRLGKADIILGEPILFPYSVLTDYAIHHNAQDLYAVEEIIAERHPEYSQDFTRVMHKTNRLSICNMFVMRREIFDDYCEWLFDILGEAEKRLHVEHYDPYQSRIYGFLAERLLNVYIAHRRRTDGFRVSYIPISQTDYTPRISALRRVMSRLRFNIGFFFTRRRR